METSPTLSDNPAERIQQLRQLINAHNHNYYILHAPTITDQEFDRLLRQLEDLEKEHPELDDPYSPTHRVGSDLAEGWEQAEHLYPMLSLANTYSITDVDDWVRRTESALMGQSVTIVGEMKFDGIGISLVYEHGRLVRAVTRGDGVHGDIVTQNIKAIRSIPLVLQPGDWPEMFEIRGEILMPWAEFDRINAERAYNEEPLLANPRNATAGTIKTLDSGLVAHRRLDAYFYYLLGPDLPADTHYECMMAARRWGFRVSDAMTRLHGLEEVDRYINHWDTARKELPVATDGLVFKVDSLRQQLNLGFTAKSPRWAVAYKFAAERALTRLRFVSFDVGRLGIITPVANLEPVLLSGTTVKRASLHNYDILRQMDIHEHDMLYVEKGGEIIPKIVDVDVEARQPGAPAIVPVTHCPACGTQLVRIEGEAATMCPNRRGCPPQVVGRIEHFVGRRMMDIDGIGEETALDLFQTGLVRDPADLYTLTANQLMTLEGIGQKSADRVIAGIEASRAVPFDRLIYALSIPMVGETVAKRLARGVRDMDTLMAMDHASLCAIDDVGPRIADSIIDYFRSPENRQMVERLRRAGLQFSIPEAEGAVVSDRLGGKQIVISGTFAHHSRDQYKAMIEAHGGKNVGSISRKTDYVLAGDNMGPAKQQKATSLGIPIIDEDTFLKMINK